MKILHVIDTADPAVGGPVESIRTLSICHAASGHEVDIVTLDPSDSPWLGRMPGKTYALGGGAGGYAFSLRLAKWLNTHSQHYDAIILNGLWKFSGAAVLWARGGSNSLSANGSSRRRKTPYFVYPHGMLDPWFKHQYPAKHLKKAVYWSLCEQHVLRNAAAVCFTCEEERILAGKTFQPYRCQERVVGLGVVRPPADSEAQKAAFLEKFPGLKGRNYLLFLGRIHEKKGADLILRTYALLKGDYQKLPDLVIAGPASSMAYQRFLYDLAGQSGLVISDGRDPALVDDRPRVHFLPMLGDDLKWGAFRGCDAFLLPSHQENFGMAVVEALACGRPVLISDKVNIWREIERDGAGLVAEDTVSGLRKLLRVWFGLSDATRTFMERRAQHCFKQSFDIQTAADALISVIRQSSVNIHS